MREPLRYKDHKAYRKDGREINKPQARWAEARRFFLTAFVRATTATKGNCKKSFFHHAASGGEVQFLLDSEGDSEGDSESSGIERTQFLPASFAR